MTLNCMKKCAEGLWGMLGDIPWHIPAPAMTSYGKGGVYEAGLVYCSVCNKQFKNSGEICPCCSSRLRKVGIYKRRKLRRGAKK